MRVFISYKSEDANHVRKVVEELERSGIETWFAEYQVLPRNYDSFVKDLSDGLENAVSQCTHGLAFTNDRWANSEHCSAEMYELLECLSRGKIIEVCLPPEETPHLKFPELQECVQLVFDGRVETLIKEIGETLGVRTGITEEVLLGNAVNLTRFGVALDLGPFEIEPHESLVAANKFTSYVVAIFSGSVNGVKTRLTFMSTPTDSPIDEFSIDESGTSNDREIYQRYLEYAGGWESENELEVIGLHLFFHGGRSHIALTYVSEVISPTEWTWERRYTLSLRNPLGQGVGEANLIFSATLTGLEKQQRASFLSLCRQFDCIAQSFSYHLPLSQPFSKANGPILVSKALLGLLSAYLAYRLPGFATAVASGIFMTDFVFFLTWVPYRRFINLSVPVVWSLDRSDGESESQDLSFWFIRGPILLLGNLVGSVLLLLRLPILLRRLPVVAPLLTILTVVVSRSIFGTPDAQLAGVLCGAALTFVGIRVVLTREIERIYS